MARTRNLKPGFFRNDKLCSLPALTRLLFAGLWTIADREGRLEDNPRRVRADIFPYEEKLGVAHVSRMLQELHDTKFIIRYEASGKRYICIPTWKQHQNPHVKEQVSTIPAPDLPGACPVREPDEHEIRTGPTVPSPNLLLPSPNLLLPTTPPPDPPPPLSLPEWEETAWAVRAYFPDADDEFVMKLVAKSCEKVLSTKGARGNVTDAAVAFAVGKCWKPSQRSAGLFLKTVPQLLATYAVTEA